MRKMLPSITQLELCIRHLSNRDFLQICAMSNLRVLSIDRAKITSLHGISNLPNLEILDLSSIKFEKKEDIEELGYLQNLQVLNLSSEASRDTNTAELFSECNIRMNALRFLDVSYNNISVEVIQKIAAKHPSLSTISLICTNLVFVEFIETVNPNLKFLSLGNSKKIQEALDYYSSPYKGSYIAYIVNRTPFDDITVNFEKSFLAALDVFKTMESDRGKQYFIGSSTRLLSSRCKQFCIENKDHIIGTLRSEFLLFEKCQNYMNYAVEERIHAAWELLRLVTSNEDSEIIHEFGFQACLFIINALPIDKPLENESEQRKSTWSCISFLCKFIEKMNPDLKIMIIEKYQIIKKVMTLAEYQYFSGFPLFYYVKLIVYLSSTNKVNKTSVRLFAAHYVMVYWGKLVQNGILGPSYTIIKTLEWVLDYLPDEQLESIADSYYWLFMRLFKPQNFDEERLEGHAASVLFTIFSRTKGYEHEDGYSERHDVYVGQFLQILDNNEEDLKNTENDAAFWAIVVSQMDSPGLLRWGYWLSKDRSFRFRSPS